MKAQGLSGKLQFARYVPRGGSPQGQAGLSQCRGCDGQICEQPDVGMGQLRRGDAGAGRLVGGLGPHAGGGPLRQEEGHREGRFTGT